MKNLSIKKSIMASFLPLMIGFLVVFGIGIYSLTSLENLVNNGFGSLNTKPYCLLNFLAISLVRLLRREN